MLLLTQLTGCIPAALVIGATAGGAIIYDKRSIKTIAQDKNAQQTAIDSIQLDPELRGKAHISVATFNRIALIVGQAPTAELKARAYQLVSEVKNLDRVYDQVTIEPPTSLYQRSRDTWITTEIKTEMLTTKDLESSQIKVITENNTVYLMGYVSRTQSDLAASVARRVAGVARVVKVFQYTY